MLDRSNFNEAQNQLLGVLTTGFNSEKERMLIGLPTGTGKTAVVTAFLQDIINRLSPRDKVVVIVLNKAIREQLKSRFIEDLDIPVSDFSGHAALLNIGVNVILLSELGKFAEVLRSVDEIEVRLVIMLDADEHSLKRSGWNAGILDARQRIAFTDYPYSGEGFGAYDFVYTISQGIKDGLLSNVRIMNVDMALSERQNGLVAEFDKAKEVDGVEIKSKIDLQSYLRLVCEDVVSRISRGKTIIFALTIQQADIIADILNNLYEARVCRAVHSNMPGEEVREILRRHKDNEAGLNILVVVDLGATLLEITAENIVLLRKYSSRQRIAHILTIALRKSHSKQYSTIFDYRNNIVFFQEIFSSVELSPAVEEVKVPRKYLSESKIRFRDKSDIDPVMAVDEIAAELSDIIEIIPGEQGSMIGVFGMWGRGKTYLMDLLWKELCKKKGFIRVDFHAWKYQDTPATWAYLYERFADRYFAGSKKRNWLRKKYFLGWRVIKLNWERQGPLPFLKIFGLLAIGILIALMADSSVLVKLGLPDYANKLKYPLLGTLWAYLVTAATKKEFSSKAKDIFLKYSSKHSFKDHLGLQAEIQKETLTLLKTWIGDKKLSERKIVLFVEDIDRCSENKVIQIIDSLRVLLEDVEIAKRVVIVAAVDERILKLAIKNKYHSLIALEKNTDEVLKTRLERITDEYMDKLFISGVKLGNLSTIDRDDFIKELTKADRAQNMRLRTLQEVVDDDNRYEGAKMSERYQEILLNADIQRQEEQNAYDESMLDDFDDVQYHTEYIKGSKPVENADEAIDQGTLAEEEVDILRFAVSKYKDATPRQIRIFYYRYLMSKNLLARRYRKLSKNNIWIETPYAKIVAKLIIEYTISVEAGILESHLTAAIASGSENMDIKLLSYTAAKTADYRELLQVLNIVIAY